MDGTPVRVLVVDDDREDFIIVRAQLAAATGGPYELEWAAVSDNARGAMAAGNYDVALIDYRLGAENGLEIIREAVSAGWPVPLILLTGRGGSEVGDEALRAGATDYLPKDRVTSDSLARAIRHAILRRRVEDRLRMSEAAAQRLALVATHTDNAVIISDALGEVEWVNDAFTRITGFTSAEAKGRRPGQFLQGAGTDLVTVARMRECVRVGEGFNVEVINYAKCGREYWVEIDCQPVRDARGELTGFVAIQSDVTARRKAADELLQAKQELETAYEATIAGWGRALDMRDHETNGHSQRVTEMTIRLGLALGLTAEELVPLKRGALLHDIGKMGIPDAILLKPGPLDEAERAIMEQHPRLALKMLAPIAFLRSALDIPYYHHERWDGSGYPRGLKGEEIPLAARIFTVVDVWDALSHDRPYRKAWSPARVRRHIRDLAGSQLDPSIVEVFLSVVHPANDGGRADRQLPRRNWHPGHSTPAPGPRHSLASQNIPELAILHEPTIEAEDDPRR